MSEELMNKLVITTATKMKTVKPIVSNVFVLKFIFAIGL